MKSDTIMGNPTNRLFSHEASCKGIPDVIEGLQRRGIPPEVLVQGLSISLADIRNPATRVDWETHCRVFENLGRVMDDEEIKKLAREMLAAKSHRFGIVVGRLLYSTGDFFRWTAKQLTKQMSAFRFRAVDLAEDRLLLEYEMYEGYRLPREFFVLIGGMYGNNTNIAGIGRNNTNIEFGDNWVRYDIQYQPGGGTFSWLRKSIGWLWAARYAAEALESADEVISRRYVDLLEETQARKEAERALIAVAEQEQERIRRDLHDRVGQELTGLSFLARHLVEGPANGNGHQNQALEAILGGIERTIGEVQAAIQGIQPVSAKPSGLTDALEEMVARMSTRTSIKFHFVCPEAVSITDAGVASHLYYIAQEAINNACKYSGASEIRLELSKAGGGICLQVEDDGVGLGSGEIKGTGLGMKIMRHRAQLIGGRIYVETSARGGVRLRCTIPNSNGRQAFNPSNDRGRERMVHGA